MGGGLLHSTGISASVLPRQTFTGIESDDFSSSDFCNYRIPPFLFLLRRIRFKSQGLCKSLMLVEEQSPLGFGLSYAGLCCDV